MGNIEKKNGRGASKLHGVKATIITFVFVLCCIVLRRME